jgi:hypothetical protein
VATNVNDRIVLKRTILSSLTARVAARLHDIQSQVSELQSSVNEETKSSAGDKYETGRAMIQLEIEQLSHQLAEHQKNLSYLEAFQPSVTDTICQGAIVTTNEGLFFISVNAGDIVVDGRKIVSISSASPLAQKLLGSKAGSTVEIMKRRISVLEVY